jgi:outer membrane lipopolysaccharide assembly protein LptE/RlpB
MIKKQIILISLVFFLTHCGFSPIYIKNTNTDFSIESVNYQGDQELNNFLKINLDSYKNKKSDRKILIEAKSGYEKNILTKNSSGDVTNYKLVASVTFLIKSNNKKINIVEEKIISSMDDKFEETRKERTIKQNFASSISNKLISELVINK